MPPPSGRTVGLALSVALLACRPAGAASPETRVSQGCCSLCKLWTGTEPDDIPNAQFATVSSLVNGPGGSKTFELRCGQADFFTFGPGLQQGFVGSSWAYGWGEARFGVLRLYAEAGARVNPTVYGPPFVIGTNPFSARARVGGALVSFVDLVTPPPTSGAPNPGDPTTIKASVHLSCTEGGLTLTGASVALYTPEAFDAQQGAYAVVQVETRDGATVFPCPLDATRNLPATVGMPVVVSGALAADMNSRVASSIVGSTVAYVDALNTSVVTLADADDNPLTGTSGYVYSAPGSLPTVTVTTSTTTTSTTLTPPTTLPTCGNGAVDAGEACDCPPTPDPVLQGYGCRGGDVIPAQSSCIVCRRCGFETHLCEVAGSTTTTTLPEAGCAELAGLALAGCLLTEALDGALCPGFPISQRTDKKLRKSLGIALRAIDKARTANEKAQRRLVKRARGRLRATARAAANAAASTKPAKQIVESCRARIVELTAAVGEALPQ